MNAAAPSSHGDSLTVLREGGAVFVHDAQGLRSDAGLYIPSSECLVSVEGIRGKRVRFMGVECARWGINDLEGLATTLRELGFLKLAKKVAATQVVKEPPPGLEVGSRLAERRAEFLRKFGVEDLPLTEKPGRWTEGEVTWEFASVDTIDFRASDERKLGGVARREEGVLVERLHVKQAMKIAPELGGAGAALLLTGFDFLEGAPLNRAAKVSDLPPVERSAVRKAFETLRYPRGMVPREYQLLGVLALRQMGYRGLLADAPGVGKTAQACIALGTEVFSSTLVVCPASVLLNWRKELRQWAPWLKVRVVGNVETIRREKVPTVYVTTWDLLPKLLGEVKHLRLKAVVLDESQYAKHAESGRSKAAAVVCGWVPHRILLSGTPLENRLPDLWHQLFLIDPQAFPTMESFQSLVRAGVREAGEVFQKWMVRRTKEQVLSELPPKVRDSRWVTLTGRDAEIYRRAEEETVEALREDYHGRVLEEAAALFLGLKEKGGKTATLLRQAWSMVDRSRVIEDVGNGKLALAKVAFLRKLVGVLKIGVTLKTCLSIKEPFIMFVEHLRVLEKVKRGLERAGLRVGVIEGSVSKLGRQIVVDSFQNGGLDVVIGTQAMHAGVTLNKASVVVFGERWWVPSREEQAEDRTHRFGQKGAEVRCVYLNASGTVDERLVELTEEKREEIAEVFQEGGEVVEEEGVVEGALVGKVIAGMLGPSEISFEVFVRYCWDKGLCT